MSRWVWVLIVLVVALLIWFFRKNMKAIVIIILSLLFLLLIWFVIWLFGSSGLSSWSPMVRQWAFWIFVILAIALLVYLFRTHVKRIIFVIVLLLLAYAIYWFITPSGAGTLWQNIQAYISGVSVPSVPSGDIDFPSKLPSSTVSLEDVVDVDLPDVVVVKHTDSYSDSSGKIDGSSNRKSNEVPSQKSLLILKEKKKPFSRPVIVSRDVWIYEQQELSAQEDIDEVFNEMLSYFEENPPVVEVEKSVEVTSVEVDVIVPVQEQKKETVVVKKTTSGGLTAQEIADAKSLFETITY